MARSSSHKVSKGIFITILVLILIAAIVLTSLYFADRELFNKIFNIVVDTIAPGEGEGQGGGSGQPDSKPGGGTDQPNTPPGGGSDPIVPPEGSIHTAGGAIAANEAPVGGNLEIHFIDVGQGDSILIRYPDGQAILIDAGGSYSSKAGHPYKERGVKTKILDYINSFGITNLYGVILTHSDSDHSAYLDDVIETYNVKNIFLPDFDGALDGSDGKDKDANGNKRKPTPGAIPTATCGQVYVAANAEQYLSTDGNTYKANVIKNLDDVMNIEGEGYKMLSYCRDAAYYDTVANGDAHMLNSVSPVTRLQYAGREIFFMGDGEGESVGAGHNDVDGWWMAKNINVDIDVLKVGHHGSAPSSSQEFLEYVDPEYAVISCGLFNKHQHPRPECIERLTNYKDVTPDTDANGIQRIYRTDQDGNIILTITPEGDMSWETRKDAAATSLDTYNVNEWYYMKKQSYALAA